MHGNILYCLEVSILASLLSLNLCRSFSILSPMLSLSEEFSWFGVLAMLHKYRLLQGKKSS